MAQFPPTITLLEAFRRILRAIYPDRPALADEIQSYDWDAFLVRDTRLTSDEVIAVNKAFGLLDERVAGEKIRLRGAPNHPSKPLEDVNPEDVRDSKLHVFAGELRVFDGNKHIKTYCRVHCYEADVDRETEQLAAHPVGALKLADIAKFVKDYLDTEPKPRLTGKTGIRDKWSAAGHGAQARDLLDEEYRNQATGRNISLKRGPKR